MLRGSYITKKDVVPGDIPVVLGGTTPAYYHNASNHEGEGVVISRSGANAGFASYWDQPIFVSDGFVVEGSSKALTKYLFHWLGSSHGALGGMRRGSGVPHITGKMLKESQIPVPPLSEQRRIVDILDRFEAFTTSLSDGLPAEIEARRQQYEHYRDKLLDFSRKVA